MGGTKLVSFDLPCSLDEFLVFFFDAEWYRSFTADKLEDLKVSVEDWKLSSSSLTGSTSTPTLVRKIHSFHPSKISFPGLPSHAESFKTQNLIILQPDASSPSSSSSSMMACVHEVNSFRDIPYAEYFNVHLDWKVTSTFSSNTSDSDSESACRVEVYLDFEFIYSTWLQSTIESNTRSELLEVFEKWRLHAISSIGWAKGCIGTNGSINGSGNGAGVVSPFFWKGEQKIPLNVFELGRGYVSIEEFVDLALNSSAHVHAPIPVPVPAPAPAPAPGALITIIACQIESKDHPSCCPCDDDITTFRTWNRSF